MKNEAKMTQDATQANPVSEPPDVTSVEVREGRRRFTQAEKIAILEELDRCEQGTRGTFLRQKGLYSSVVYGWRAQMQVGAGLTPKKRGRKSGANRGAAEELVKMRRQMARLEERNRQLLLIIDVQKKVSQMLGLTLPEEVL